MSFLLYEYSYCLNEWSPFDQVSRSFCDLTTRTRLLAYMKYPGNMQLNRLRGLRINSLTSSRSKATVINCVTALRCPKECFRGLWTLVSSSIIILNFQRGMRVIQPVTSQRCFGRAKMAANFKLNRSTSNCWKSSFRSLHAKKKSAVFLTKVQTLLLSKNLTCENFVSVALWAVYGWHLFSHLHRYLIRFAVVFSQSLMTRVSIAFSLKSLN